MTVRNLLALALTLPLALTLSPAACPATPANGDFEAEPNTDWLRAGPGAPRTAAGDQPHIARTGIGRFARVGDRDGRGADGESPSHFFQRFPCAGTDDGDGDGSSDGGPCRITFRFRTSLGRDDVAWVRLGAADLERFWLLPASGGEWKGPVTVEAGECGADLVVDFGIQARDGSTVSGTLDVDDVRAVCGGPDPELTVPPAPELAGLLPALPVGSAAGSAAGVPLPLVMPRGPSGPGIAALVAAGLFVTLFLLFVVKKAREQGPGAA